MKKKIKKNINFWGGRFNESPSETMIRINSSINYDNILYKQDIKGSKAHAKMLYNQKIITENEFKRISLALDKIEIEFDKNKINFDDKLEDIHTHVENRLIQLVGPVGKKLHTARSRNDQIATDVKLWIKEENFNIINLIKTLQNTLIRKAEEHIFSYMPGFTHLQAAQPITLAHHLLAYVNMFGRDRENSESIIKRHNFSPLGSAALAGTVFNVNRDETANSLGFTAPMNNSIDAVSDRDFVLDTLHLCCCISSHLSRLSEEIILWSSPGFNFLKLPDAFSTGSSIMPQKKNPDAAELIRGKSGRTLGNYVSLFTTMKALPLAYSKDMQEDKEPVFDVYDTLILVIKITQELIDNMKVKKRNMYEAASNGFSTATDMADWFVRELGMPFREAHSLTSKFVEIASEKKIKLNELTLSDLTRFEPKINESVFKVLSPHNSIESRNSFGGTASREIKRQIRFWKRRLNA